MADNKQNYFKPSHPIYNLRKICDKKFPTFSAAEKDGILYYACGRNIGIFGTRLMFPCKITFADSYATCVSDKIKKFVQLSNYLENAFDEADIYIFDNHGFLKPDVTEQFLVWLKEVRQALIDRRASVSHGEPGHQA